MKLPIFGREEVSQFVMSDVEKPSRSCYIVFTINENGTHAHITVTRDPMFRTSEQTYDRLGPFEIGRDLDQAEIEHKIAQSLTDWLAQATNVDWLRRSNTPVGVFHDARTMDALLISSIPELVRDCIHRNKVTLAKVYDLDPRDIGSWCKV